MNKSGQASIAILRKAVKLLLEGKSATELFLDETLDGISLEKVKEIEVLIKSIPIG